MYVTMRRVHCAPGRLFDVLSLGVPLAELIKERFGVEMGIGTMVGGDPDVVGATSRWETLGAYQAYRDAVLADEEVVAKFAEIGAMTSSMEDFIGRVLVAPGGEPTTFSVVNEARMHMPRITDAIPFGLEVSEFVEAKTGTKNGFVAAMTGDRSRVAWLSRFDTLDAAAELGETLEADPEYLDLFKRADGIYVDGSLEQSIWHWIA